MRPSRTPLQLKEKTPLITRNRLVSFLAVVTVAGSLGSAAVPPRAHAADSTAYNLIMNWFPEPEEGGFYNAQRLGLYQKYGISSKIADFGYSVIPWNYVLAGKAAFGMGNADELLQYRAKGAPVVAIMSTQQTNVQGLLWHAEDTSIKTIADLSNHTLIYSVGAGYYPYLVQKYKYTNLKTRNYDFTPRAFYLDKAAVNQCYVTSEPHAWAKNGTKIKSLLIADSGYNPYGDLIFTTESMIKDHPDVVRAYVKATIEGWQMYLKDPKATHAYMALAPGAKSFPLKPDEMDFSYAQLKKLGILEGGDAKTHGLGYLSADRLTTLKQQMVSINFKPSVANVDVSKAFTTEFLPKMAM